MLQHSSPAKHGEIAGRHVAQKPFTQRQSPSQGPVQGPPGHLFGASVVVVVVVTGGRVVVVGRDVVVLVVVLVVVAAGHSPTKLKGLAF